MPTLVLSAICLVVAFSLALINEVTGPIIEEAQNQAANAALLEVLPDGKDFKELTLDEKYPSAITKGYKADGGFVFQATVTGKSSGLIIMIGVDSNGKIVGTKVIADQETDDYDAKVFPLVSGTEGSYKGMALDGFEPLLVSGATLTSKAYGEAVKSALQAFTIANGGEVDIRTPEQILQDNCNTALGTTGVKFNKWFDVEAVEGFDAIYEAEDGSGRVFVTGENFVGVKADGTIVGNVADSDKMIAANEIISASALTEVAKPEGTSRLITKIYKTASGNYVFEATASGFSAEYHGTDIILKVSISADGKIIDCLTVNHSESKGYGDACATEEYYDSWRGVGADEVIVSNSPITDATTDPGAISGATYTSNGYQKAIKKAFEAFELITADEGGNQ